MANSMSVQPTAYKGIQPGLVPSGVNVTGNAFLKHDGTWATPTGAGNVSGPGSSINNSISTWNGTTGTTLFSTGATMTASGNLLTFAGASTITDNGSGGITVAGLAAGGGTLGINQGGAWTGSAGGAGTYAFNNAATTNFNFGGNTTFSVNRTGSSAATVGLTATTSASALYLIGGASSIGYNSGNSLIFGSATAVSGAITTQMTLSSASLSVSLGTTSSVLIGPNGSNAAVGVVSLSGSLANANIVGMDSAGTGAGLNLKTSSATTISFQAGGTSFGTWGAATLTVSAATAGTSVSTGALIVNNQFSVSGSNGNVYSSGLLTVAGGAVINGLDGTTVFSTRSATSNNTVNGAFNVVSTNGGSQSFLTASISASTTSLTFGSGNSDAGLVITRDNSNIASFVSHVSAAGLAESIQFVTSSGPSPAWGAGGIIIRNSAGTFTDSSTAASGTAALETFYSFAQPTLAATNSTVTTTIASTVYIAGAPVAGTNQTIPNAYALQVASGASLFGGNVTSTGTGLFLHTGGNGTSPTIAAGTGAGTSPTVTLTGHDKAFTISVTTGTLPTLAGVVATVTFNTAFANAPHFSLTPSSAAASLLSGATMVTPSSTTTTFVLTAGATALTAATAYTWEVLTEQ